MGTKCNSEKAWGRAIPLLRGVQGCVLPLVTQFPVLWRAAGIQSAGFRIAMSFKPIAMRPEIKNYWFVLFSLLLTITSCADNNEQEIRRKLKSKSLDDVFEGTYSAGMSGNKKYVPLLLNAAANPSASSSLHFKGFTLYTEKMYALERILHVKPPHSCNGVLRMPDSVNIKFFQRVWDVEKSY
ncbi:hypothetical protein [Mucilaginibacter sp.]|uniref:hypothetical protein n=1 Tax=Mucilaginibacter sp. TaxID=1882438 RepID=UPI002624E210|nr:hypothetical protein [Mucilaginibacter sp.]MDB4923926.1 hypothetical protein [Mucilaginibacter sp.]